MRVMVLDTLIKQTNGDPYVPHEAIPKIYQEYERLAEMERQGTHSLQSYLAALGGKAMRGADHVFKFELSGGDRILYTYGSSLPWTKDDERDTLVLVRFSKHDDQGNVAQKFDHTKPRGYQYVSEIVDFMHEQEISFQSDYDIEDILAIGELLNEPAYTYWHKCYVVSEDEDFKNLSYEDMEFRISSEQECILNAFANQPKPTLVIGGAGTGKTVIAVHALHDFSLSMHNAEEKNKIGVYFTQSPELRQKVSAIYDSLKKDDGEESECYPVVFEDINEYCIRTLAISRKTLFTTDDFVRLCSGNPEIAELCRRNAITPITAWSEIRGIIKGAMSKEWTYAKPLSQDRPEFEHNVQYLVNHGYLKRGQDKRHKELTLADAPLTIQTKLSLDNEIPDKDREKVLFALDYFQSFDGDKKMLLWEEYEAVPGERTTLEQEKRATAWKICQIYQKHLQQNNQLDDNDLVRLMFKHKMVEESYDFIAIDEVQDYTELQLYLLLCLSGKKQVILAGDEHQNINPASFNESRLKDFFKTGNGTSLTTNRLRQNFRCQQGIIGMTNRLAEIRRKVIGSGSCENELEETAQREGITPPLRLKYTRENLRKLVLEISRLPRTVVLVPDEETKKRIQQLYPEDDTGMHPVYTVAEVKGMEYRYVVCYNIIGAYRRIWAELLSGTAQKRQTKYRYYFNLLYVAATRAQDFLCLVDESDMDGDPVSDIPYIAEYSRELLYLNELTDTDEDYYKQARSQEENGLYEEALESYRRAGAPEEDILRCRYWKAFNRDRDYDTALLCALRLEDVQKILDAYGDASPHGRTIAELYLHVKNNDFSKLELRGRNINRTVDLWLANIAAQEEISALKDVLVRNLHLAMQQVTGSIHADLERGESENDE